ncbi:hypothetical protein LBMAG18_11070 [Alphaproteobacteria bacterium]|nr:hypothetical protein LBMAG18_11070 [Alphaproteobacteria bacterium]
MLFFNIITVEELSSILRLGPTETKIIKSMLNETRNITNNILRVLSEVIEHLFGWAGLDNVNLELINIDLHENANKNNNFSGNPNPSDCPAGNPDCPKSSGK